jgi:hypothetical protein
LGNAETAAARLAKLGVDKGALPLATLAVLGAKPAMELNQQHYKPLAELARDADYGPKELGDTIKHVKETIAEDSDAAAVTYIADVRTDAATRISDFRMFGRTTPSPTGVLMQRVGYINKTVATNPSRFVEADAAKAAALREALETAVATLNKVLAAQPVLAAADAETETEDA